VAQVAEGVLDLDDYDTLAFRVRGDGRKYIASLRTENWMVDAKSQDVWQAFLFARCSKLCCTRCNSMTTALLNKFMCSDQQVGCVVCCNERWTLLRTWLQERGVGRS
jgi:Complex I intermediate-associated protein 30 (CIA30)